MLDRGSSADRRLWKRLVDQSDQQTPFSTLAFADAMANARTYFARLIGTSRPSETGDLSAGVLIFERRRGPYRLARIPPFTPYTPVLTRSDISEADINHRRGPLTGLIRFLEERYHDIALHLHPSQADVRLFQWADWSTEPLYTYLHQISKENPYAAWSGSARRLAEQHEDAFEIREGPETVGSITDLCRESYNRKERALPGHSAERLTQIARSLVEHGMARALLARTRDSGNPSAGTVVLLQKPTAYYWMAGSKRGPGMTVLLKETFARLRQEGYTRMDMVGANTPSVAEFKRSFGVELTSYFRVHRCRRPELRMLNSLRQFIRTPL